MARSWKFIPQVVAYPSYGTTCQVRVLGRVLLASRSHGGQRGNGSAPAGTENVRGWRAFTSVPIQNAAVDIEIGGAVHRVQADPGGLIDAALDVHLDPGWHTAVLRAPGTESVEAPVFIVAPTTRLGIVSDIDDTVMVTALPRPFLAIWNTFVLSERARTPTPGIAVLLDRFFVEHPQIPVIYLSTGPWNAAPAIARFLARNLYPAGTLLLTDWGLTQDRWFRSGVEHKERNLERLAKEFPDIRWLLVGDDGQHDEEVYTRFLHRWPDRVAAVVIRQLSPSEAVLAGGRSHEGGHAGPANTVPWIYAPDGAEAFRQLRDLGLV